MVFISWDNFYISQKSFWEVLRYNNAKSIKLFCNFSLFLKYSVKWKFTINKNVFWSKFKISKLYSSNHRVYISSGPYFCPPPPSLLSYFIPNVTTQKSTFLFLNFPFTLPCRKKIIFFYLKGLAYVSWVSQN